VLSGGEESSYEKDERNKSLRLSGGGLLWGVAPAVSPVFCVPAGPYFVFIAVEVFSRGRILKTAIGYVPPHRRGSGLSEGVLNGVTF
jgi:hypothetical protein